MIGFRFGKFRQDLAAKAKKFEHAGSGQFTQSLTEAVERSVAPLEEEARARARTTLPQRGGLGALVASTWITHRARRTGRVASVLISAHPGSVKDPEAIDRGRVRHPYWGHWPGTVKIQLVPPGWFTVPMAKGGPQVREELLQAIHEEIVRLED